MLAWATRVIRHPGSVLFLSAVVFAVVHVGAALLVGARREPWRASRRAIVSVAVLAAVVAFDVRTLDVFNVTKFTIVLVAAALVTATWLLQWGWSADAPTLRPALLWPVVAIVVATAIATASSVNVRMSVLGSYGSYDGLALVVACAVLFLAIGDSFDASHVRACVCGLFGAGGGLVALYALFQTHDQVLEGASPWDWVTWGESSFRTTAAIWSTLGNPNHLAGFIVILLPLGVVLGLGAGSRRERVLIVALEALLLVELVQTTTRGAWVAAAVSLPLLALLLSPEIRSHRRVAMLLGGGFVMFALLSLAVVVATPSLNARYRALIDVGGRDSLTARIELSRAALRIGSEQPLAGAGPDMFRIAFQRHQTPRFVELFGPRRVANGAHNMFLNQFATQGLIGLGALVWLVGAGVWRGVAAMRVDAERRVLAAGLLAALVAFLVQATFNVQQVALTVVFWALLGLIEVFARTRPAADTQASAASNSAGKPAPGDLRRAVAVLAALGCVACGAVGLRPYLADDSALRAARLATEERYGAARRHVKRAHLINPWEPRYLAAQAELSARAARAMRGNPERRLRQSARAYQRLISLYPHDARFLHDYSEVLAALGDAPAARHVMWLAVEANPHDPLLKEKFAALSSRAAGNEGAAPSPPRGVGTTTTTIRPPPGVVDAP